MADSGCLINRVTFQNGRSHGGAQVAIGYLLRGLDVTLLDGRREPKRLKDIEYGILFYFILGGKDRVEGEKVPGGQKCFDKYLTLPCPK